MNDEFLLWRILIVGFMVFGVNDGIFFVEAVILYRFYFYVELNYG